MRLVWIQQEANSENDQAMALSLYFEGNPTLEQVEAFIDILPKDENRRLRDLFGSGSLIDTRIKAVWSVPSTPIMREGLTKFQCTAA